MLESSLRDIMDRIQAKDADFHDLGNQLQFETENYLDLSGRVDSRLDLAIQHAGTFYSLKSRIESMKEEAELQPEPLP